ncbi:hypothetical protein QBC41DRAFT_319587 [Cercophora samala]|uniref:Uncharacterized protein n=1 Tax=Cercophora samala TaxID=330535 RepID=A0AA39ZEL8_9PEZI|nr:hypothetical protein QBC41DRAFT_319587 [Cercophora samala]
MTNYIIRPLRPPLLLIDVLSAVLACPRISRELLARGSGARPFTLCASRASRPLLGNRNSTVGVNSTRKSMNGSDMEEAWLDSKWYGKLGYNKQEALQGELIDLQR